MATLDSNILSLMNQTVSWERFTSDNAYGDAQYAAPVSLKCFVEGSYSRGGVVNKQGKDVTTYDPEMNLYFDGNDANVQLFSMKDRFTVSAQEGVEVLRGRPDSMGTSSGGQGEPWLFVVSL